MSDIEIYIDGRSYAEKGSGFGVVLISPNNKWIRSFAYGKNSVNKSDLLALKLAFLSVCDLNNNIIVNTKNDYIINIFKKNDDGQYVQNPSSNIELINEIRQLFIGINISFKKSDGDLAKVCKDIAIDAIKKEILVDIRR